MLNTFKIIAKMDIHLPLRFEFLLKSTKENTISKIPPIKVTSGVQLGKEIPEIKKKNPNVIIERISAKIAFLLYIIN